MNKHFFLSILMAALFAVAFTSCDKENVGEYLVSGTISGEHASWEKISASFDSGDTWASTTKISKEKFKLKLPAPQTDHILPIGYASGFLPDSLKISDLSAKTAFVSFFARNEDQTAELTLMNYSYSITGVSMTMVEYMYVDKNVNISGSYEIKEVVGAIEASMKMLFDLKLKEGWNIVVSNTKISMAGNVAVSVTTGEVPSGLTWSASTLFMKAPSAKGVFRGIDPMAVERLLNSK